MAVERPKVARSIRTMSIYLLQEPLEPMLVSPSIARRTIPETEIWRASQRSSNAGGWGWDCFLLR
jgi:hypothetical protein